MAAKVVAVYACQSCGADVAQVAGPLSRVRRVELLRRGDAGPGRAGGRRCSRRAALAIGRIEVEDEGRARHGARRPRSRARRRPGPGLGVLIGGEPGIGKSTLLLQAGRGARRRRARRALRERRGVGRAGPPARGAARDPRGAAARARGDRRLARSWRRPRRAAPAVRRVDSVQAVREPSLASAPGTVSQVRAAAAELTRYAKSRGIPVLLVGHVTKDGSLGGPEVARAPRGRRDLDRGRPGLVPAAAARDEEPLRAGRRDRAVRDDGRGPDGAARRVGDAAGRARRGPAGQRRHRRSRGNPLGARRDPGARRRGLGGIAAARRHRRRSGPARAPARRARGGGARRSRRARSSSRAPAGSR